MKLIFSNFAKTALSLSIVFLAPLTATLDVSSIKDDESILVPQGKPMTLDGRWPIKTEWLDSSETKIENEGMTAYFRIKHDNLFVYVLIDFISDYGLERSRDLGAVCFDTKNDSVNAPDTNDYCFYRFTIPNGHLDGIMRGNGREWIILQEAKGHDPYETMEFFEGRMAYSQLNNPYDSVNKHVSYELRIPKAVYGLNDVMKLYVYINDGYSNSFLEWLTDAGGTQYITKLRDVIPSPISWGSLSLEGSEEGEIPKAELHTPEENLEVIVQAKQIRDVIIVSLRNSDDSTISIHTFKILLPDAILKAFKGPKDWTRESFGDNEGIFSSLTNPIDSGSKTYFLLKVDRSKPIIEWTVYSSDRNNFAEGSITPRNSR